MSDDTVKRRAPLRSARIRESEHVLQAAKALRSANPGLSVSDNQVFNTLVERGARALLTDLELGGELPGLGGTD